MNESSDAALAEQILVGVDAGGTFTDFVCLQIGSGMTLSIHKTLSTPAAPEQAIMQGIEAMGLMPYVERGRLHIIHGSTVATNAALEGKQARTAFVTNHGLGDMLTLGRQTRPELYALEFPPQQVPVAESLCLETGGRLAADGSVVEPLEPSDLDALVEKILDLAPEAVAINLLFSFMDERFELDIEQALREADPSMFVSRSSDVLPVYREYERGIATWLNASLGPVVSGYLGRLQQGLGDCPLQIMQSSGETIAASRAADSAVHLLLSGPAGGLTAMRFLGQQMHAHRIISFDMGGTSTDVALLDGDIATTSEGTIDRYPVAVPMVDMHTIGAGGGSIARVDSGGMLQVGPQSAGADPGPACYDKNGVEATVTDANLVLGRLITRVKLAGGLQLRKDLAQQAIKKLADEIGMTVSDTALGIVAIANEHMAKAIRLISVNRGYDPGEFLLASFGGAGGLHVCAIADAMQMQRAMVPAYGGVLSALGMLVADRGRQFTKTVGVIASKTDTASLNSEIAELTHRGKQELAEEGLDPEALKVKVSADLCYQGQSYTLNVAWQNLAQAISDFGELHEARYGYALSTDIEIVNLRVTVLASSQVSALPESGSAQSCNKVDSVEVYGEADRAEVLARESLAIGQRIDGPAIITEYSATTYVASAWHATLDSAGNLMLEKS